MTILLEFIWNSEKSCQASNQNPQMADIDKMIDQEGPPEGAQEVLSPTRELSTPTQDEDPNPIEGLIHTLAPGVSASGVQAAASALKGFVPVPMATTMPTSPSKNHNSNDNIEESGGCDTGMGAVDEISDEELQEVEDLANIAVAKPVIVHEETSGRLSSVSSISNNSDENEITENNPVGEGVFPKKFGEFLGGDNTNGNTNADQEDELSLSGLSSSDELKIDEHKNNSRSDVEDGEINEQQHHNNQQPSMMSTKQKNRQRSKDSSDSSDQENENRNRRRFRKRSTGSENQRSRSKSSDSDRPISPRLVNYFYLLNIIFDGKILIF